MEFQLNESVCVCAGAVAIVLSRSRTTTTVTWMMMTMNRDVNHLALHLILSPFYPKLFLFEQQSTNIVGFFVQYSWLMR